MSFLEGLEKKYGLPKLTPTYMAVSQFELVIEDENLTTMAKPLIPSEALIYESFKDGIDVIFRGRFITNLLPSVSKIMMDLVFLPEGGDEFKDAQEVATNLLIAEKNQFTDLSPMASFNLDGKFGNFKLPGPGLLNFNLKFLIEDKEVSEEQFPLLNTICSIPVILYKEGERDVKSSGE